MVKYSNINKIDEIVIHNVFRVWKFHYHKEKITRRFFSKDIIVTDCYEDVEEWGSDPVYYTAEEILAMKYNNTESFYFIESNRVFYKSKVIIRFGKHIADTIMYFDTYDIAKIWVAKFVADNNINELKIIKI